MASDTLRAMVRALRGVQEQGDSYLMADDQEVTVHAGRQGAGFTVPGVVKITLQSGFVVLDTRKEQHFVLVEEDVRAIGQEPSTHEGGKPGRKTGFV